MDKICTYLFFLHDRRSPPHIPHLRRIKKDISTPESSLKGVWSVGEEVLTDRDKHKNTFANIYAQRTFLHLT